MTTLVNEKDFASLQSEWNRLLLASDNPGFFLSHEWLFNWWQKFGLGHTLYLIQVRDDQGALQALAPLYLESSRIMNRCSYRTLHIIGTNQAYPDHLGFIIHKDHRSDAIAGLLRFLMEHAEHWDELQIESIPADDQGTMAFLRALELERKHLSLNWNQKIIYIDLPDHFDDYFAEFKRKQRYNLKRQWRQFEEEYNGRFGRAKTKEEARQVLYRLFHLHHLRADAVGRHEAFSDLRIRNMHQDLVDTCFDRGQIKLYYLQIADQYEACLLGYTFHDQFYFYQIGYNPEFDHISLGTTMVQKAIEQSIVEGCRTFDFLRGEEPYKRRWTKSEKTVHFVRIYRKNAKGYLAYGYRAARKLASRIKNRVLRLFHLSTLMTTPLLEQGTLIDTVKSLAYSFLTNQGNVLLGLLGVESAL